MRDIDKLFKQKQKEKNENKYKRTQNYRCKGDKDDKFSGGKNDRVYGYPEN